MNVRLMLAGALVASAAQMTEATELATDTLQDKDVILHLPLDSDFLSISNAVANPSAIQTNGNSVTFRASETSGQFVVDSAGAGRGRDNGGYLHISKSQVILDLTAFGIGYGVTNVTVEGYIRGTYPGNMAGWGSVVSLGAWTNTNGSITFNDNYYVLLSPTATAGQGHIRADTPLVNGAKKNVTLDVTNVLNGVWHHFAYVISPITADWAPEGMRLSFYLDHKYINRRECAARWHGYSDIGDDRRLYLVLGHPSSIVDLDEIRISKGSLEAHEFLRLRDREPVDGETVFHLTFDSQDLMSSAFTNDQPIQVSGVTPTGYSTDVPGPYLSNGRHATEKRANTHSLYMDSRQMNLYISNWLLGEHGLKTLTLEFFIKGEAEHQANPWVGPFGLQNPNDKFPFLVQTDNSHNYFLRTDLPYWNGTGTEKTSFDLICHPKVPFNDGKWHHVALTVQEKPNETSRVEIFFDHVSQGVQQSPNHAWRGLTNKGFMRFGYKNGGKVWIDEVRVTKGVLTKDQMMYRRLEDGSVMILK